MVWICLLLLFTLGSTYSFAEMQILLDGKPVPFTATSGHPFIDGNNRTQVPFRQVLEAFGAEVSWDAETRTAIAEYNGDIVQVPIGERALYKNGIKYRLDAEAQIVDGRTYLPVRAVVESFGAAVGWDAENSAVSVSRGSLVTPTYAPAQEIEVGMAETDVSASLGEPDRIVKSVYGFDWWIYRADDKGHFEVGIGDHTVQAVYGMGTTNYWAYSVASGQGKAEVEAAYGEPLQGIRRGNTIYLNSYKYAEVYEQAETYTWVFYDHLADAVVSAVLVISKPVEEAFSQDFLNGDPLVHSYEQHVLELTNAVRERFGLAPLTNNEEVALVARSHSEDMAVRQYFQHTNLDGLDPFDRMDQAGIRFRRAAENIAAGQYTPMLVVEGWLNSAGHRENLLGAFEELGTGVYFGGDMSVYYTQNFITQPK